MKNDNDTSSISFTAHYTGYVWYQHGLSHPAFMTKQGQTYYRILQPLEYMARQLVGSSVQTTLLQRHALIDRELEALITQYPDLQIVELACGLSPRGHRFCKKHKTISYLEADLPGMVAQKKALLTQLNALNDRHRITCCNILDKNTADSLENVISRECDTSRPLVIITEGLINYFSLNIISPVWQRIATLLKAYPVGTYITDVYPQVEDHRFSFIIKAANQFLRIASRSGFTLHFSNENAIQKHFQSLGFLNVSVFNPDNEKADMPKAKGGSIVRVIHARS